MARSLAGSVRFAEGCEALLSVFPRPAVRSPGKLASQQHKGCHRVCLTAVCLNRTPPSSLPPGVFLFPVGPSCTTSLVVVLFIFLWCASCLLPCSVVETVVSFLPFGRHYCYCYHSRPEKVYSCHHRCCDSSRRLSSLFDRNFIFTARSRQVRAVIKGHLGINLMTIEIITSCPLVPKKKETPLISRMKHQSRIQILSQRFYFPFPHTNERE